MLFFILEHYSMGDNSYVASLIIGEPVEASFEFPSSGQTQTVVQSSSSSSTIPPTSTDEVHFLFSKTIDLLRDSFFDSDKQFLERLNAACRCVIYFD